MKKLSIEKRVFDSLDSNVATAGLTRDELIRDVNFYGLDDITGVITDKAMKVIGNRIDQLTKAGKIILSSTFDGTPYYYMPPEPRPIETPGTVPAVEVNFEKMTSDERVAYSMANHPDRGNLGRVVRLQYFDIEEGRGKFDWESMDPIVTEDFEEKIRDALIPVSSFADARAIVTPILTAAVTAVAA